MSLCLVLGTPRISTIQQSSAELQADIEAPGRGLSMCLFFPSSLYPITQE